MARKPTQKKIPDPAANVDNEAIAEAAKAVNVNGKRLMEIDTTYGDGLPYDKGRLINETQFYLQQSATAMLEAGKRLILLKEHELHGDFTEALNHIGVVPSTARRLMQAAVKYTGTKSKLAVLDKSKLLELMTEDDDDLEALADGGTLAGHTLDEIDRMPVRELRESLRKERDEHQKDTEASDTLIAAKDQKLNELAKKLRKGPVIPTWPELTQQVNVETATAAGQALLACDQLDALREQILNGDYEGMDPAETEQAVEFMAVSYFDALAQLRAKVGELWDNCYEVFLGYKAAADARAANISDNEYGDLNN